MSTQAVSQMNIRMDTQLKDTGDKVLAERNTTPTQLVRSLWEKVSRYASDLQQVEEVLGISAPPAPSPDAVASKLEAMQRGRDLFVQGLATWNIAESAEIAHQEHADTDRYTEELIDRMQEGDLWQPARRTLSWWTPTSGSISTSTHGPIAPSPMRSWTPPSHRVWS